MKDELPDEYLPKLQTMARKTFWGKENYRTPIPRREPPWDPADQRRLTKILHLAQAASTIDKIYDYKDYCLERLQTYIQEPPTTRRCDQHGMEVRGCYHNHELHNLINPIFDKLLKEQSALETAEYYFSIGFRSESDMIKEREEEDARACGSFGPATWSPEALMARVREIDEQKKRNYLGPKLRSFSDDVNEEDRKKDEDRRWGKRPCLSIIRNN